MEILLVYYTLDDLNHLLNTAKSNLPETEQLKLQAKRKTTFEERSLGKPPQNQFRLVFFNRLLASRFVSTGETNQR